MVFGAVLGQASSPAAIRILAAPEWKDLLARHPKQANLTETTNVLSAVFGLTRRHSWRVFALTVGPAALLAQSIFLALHRPPGFWRLAGECLTLSVGGTGIVTGLLFALATLQGGLVIGPE